MRFPHTLQSIFSVCNVASTIIAIYIYLRLSLTGMLLMLEHKLFQLRRHRWFGHVLVYWFLVVSTDALQSLQPEQTSTLCPSQLQLYCYCSCTVDRTVQSKNKTHESTQYRAKSFPEEKICLYRSKLKKLSRAWIIADRMVLNAFTISGLAFTCL